MKPAPRLVPPVPKPVDAPRRIRLLHSQLLAAAIRYVRHGAELTRGDRLRLASDLSGIPIGMLDAAARSGGRS